MLGIEQPPSLPHVLNAHRPLHYSAYFDEESAGWISQRFARDIERFDYRFETR